MISKLHWALEHGSTVWPKASTFARPKIPVQTHKSYERILQVIQEAQGTGSRRWLTFGLFVLSLFGKLSPSKIAVVQSHHHLCTR